MKILSFLKRQNSVLLTTIIGLIIIGILICLPTGYEDALIYKGTERAVGKVVETNNSAIITSGLIQSGEQICTLEIEGGLFKGKTLEGVNFQMCIRDRKRNRYEHQETSGNRLLPWNSS